MGAVLPLRRVLPGQSQICLVHQGGALQGMVAALVPQVVVRQAAQLVVDQGHQGFEGPPVAFSPTD
jgi:hypothetical protein